jgi:hypothetical protein
MGLLYNPQVHRLPFNGYCDSFPATEQLVYAVNQSPPFIAKLNISGAIPLLCPYAFVVWPGSLFLPFMRPAKCSQQHTMYLYTEPF